jgi:hypothetical protein
VPTPGDVGEGGFPLPDQVFFLLSRKSFSVNSTEAYCYRRICGQAISAAQIEGRKYSQKWLGSANEGRKYFRGDLDNLFLFLK